MQKNILQTQRAVACYRLPLLEPARYAAVELFEMNG